jgi:hypothetical protein
LSYRVVSRDPERWLLADDTSATYQLAEFECALGKEWLTLTPTRDFPDDDGARVTLDPLLRSWEAANEVHADAAFDFRYHGCTLEGDDGKRHVRRVFGISYSIGVAPTREPKLETRTFTALPEPPAAFGSTEALDIIQDPRHQQPPRERRHVPRALSQRGGSITGPRRRRTLCSRSVRKCPARPNSWTLP